MAPLRLAGLMEFHVLETEPPKLRTKFMAVVDAAEGPPRNWRQSSGGRLGAQLGLFATGAAASLRFQGLQKAFRQWNSHDEVTSNASTPKDPTREEREKHTY